MDGMIQKDTDGCSVRVAKGGWIVLSIWIWDCWSDAAIVFDHAGTGDSLGSNITAVDVVDLTTIMALTNVRTILTILTIKLCNSNSRHLGRNIKIIKSKVMID